MGHYWWQWCKSKAPSGLRKTQHGVRLGAACSNVDFLQCYCQQKVQGGSVEAANALLKMPL